MFQTTYNDEIKTLEAALALIDECGDSSATVFVGGDSSSTSRDLSEIDTTPFNMEVICKADCQESSDEQEIIRLKAKLTVPGRNRSRDLQKLELLQLRVEAIALQQQVDALENRGLLGAEGSRKPCVSPNGSALTKRSSDMLTDAWKNLAKRHRTLRREAELENQNLRELYANQLKTATLLQKLLMKQASIA
ncbi:uncharacterized protein IUM83_10142 [Phytophthora cinnamomi]|uniref:uncharacterized protein n=1 Tax=Phytophthora cinnamomi TaxID=4785 RepID=UPI003559ADA9|nr:hypothetical protein IUM83_10142 [Phytophthora cinnamomi]